MGECEKSDCRRPAITIDDIAGKHLCAEHDEEFHLFVALVLLAESDWASRNEDC